MEGDYTQLSRVHYGHELFHRSILINIQFPIGRDAVNDCATNSTLNSSRFDRSLGTSIRFAARRGDILT